ncbi:MAG: cupin domain-containing protein [marine benthic group bacterium]|nr:cupin domain-containing protein [Gemmatimonadota bacterium]
MSDRDNPLERPTTPGSIIELQQGAVVSRTIVRQPSGNVTLFAFDEGEGLAEHVTPHEAMILALEGDAEITVGSDRHRLRDGEALHLPASVPHGIRARSPFKMMLVMLKKAEI